MPPLARRIECAMCGKRIVGRAARVSVSITGMVGARVLDGRTRRHGVLHSRCVPWADALTPTPVVTMRELGLEREESTS